MIDETWNAGGRPGDLPDDDDPAEGNWHPPLEKDPPLPKRIARELAEIPPDETGTQPYWRETFTKARMPTSGGTPEGPTSDTAQLPPPFAPKTEPEKYNVDVPAPMPGQTGGTKDIINRLPPAAPKVPGTLDQPTKPKFFFSPPPQDPGEIQYTEADDPDQYTGRHLGGSLGAINA
jgi:hypothetical protein